MGVLLSAGAEVVGALLAVVEHLGLIPSGLQDSKPAAICLPSSLGTSQRIKLACIYPSGMLNKFFDAREAVAYARTDCTRVSIGWNAVG